MKEQNAQAHKKLYNNIRSMPLKSSAATQFVDPLVNKM